MFRLPWRDVGCCLQMNDEAMMRFVMCGCGCAAVVCACVGVACGQQGVTGGSVTGRVVDATGAGVAGAKVVALMVATNQAYEVASDGLGRFRVGFLPVGEYRVGVTAKGFAEATQRVEVTVGSAFDVTLRMGVEGASATVQVVAEAPVVEVGRSQVGETVETVEVENLPFEGRNTLDLGLLLPGVSPTNTASTQTLAETAGVVGQGYSVNSQRNFSNSFIVDGMSANDDAAGLAANVPGMDAVAEFQVVTSGGQAEFGRALGGYFNLVTKMGTNTVHGTGYGFLRNQRLNAENALSGSKLPLTQGQYGASLGGPLRRDKAFLFGNFEEQRLRTDGIVTVSGTNAAVIDARLSAVGYTGPLLPLGPGATTVYPTTLHADNLFARGDDRVSANDRMEVRYGFYRLSSLNARGSGALNEVSNGTSVYDTNHTIAVSNIATLSQRTFNETRVQYIHDNLYAPPNDMVGPTVAIAGVATFGRSTSSPVGRVNDLGEVIDNVVWQRGGHTLKAGVDFLYNRDTITFPMALKGSYSFSSLASFLSGSYNSQGFTQNFGNDVVTQGNPSVGTYAQDEWKIPGGLTLNLGVRYDVEWLETLRTDVGDVSPRVGFAWAPYGDRRTVVRGSYGIFYDRIPLRPLANALLSAHNMMDAAQAALLSYTFSPGQTGAPGFPGVAGLPPVGAVLNYSLMDKGVKHAGAQEVSVGVEQQVFARGSLGVSYQHLRGEHLLGTVNTNVNVDGSRPDVTRGNVKPYKSVFDSYYDGLEVSYVQRPVEWGSARISYVYSKAMDDIGEFFFSGPLNNFDLREDRSRADDDQRHRVVFDASVTTLGKRAHGLVEEVTHGWRLGGILQYYSRLPFNVTTGGTTRQGTSQRPCAAGFSLVGVNACTEGLRGAVIGRNAGVGFDFFTVNARLSRTFAVGDGVKVEGMVEGFNALNHRNDMVPNGTFGTGAVASAAFGKETAVGDPRSVQVGARVSF